MKKRLKTFVACILVILLVGLFFGCTTPEAESTTDTATSEEVTTSEEATTSEETTTTDEETAEKEWTFAYIIPSFEANWYLRIVEGFQMGAEEVGAEVMVLNSQYDADKEVANIDLAIAQQVDGICMFSFNETGGPLAVKKGAEAGIPVVSADSMGRSILYGYDNVACVDFNFATMGVTLAEWMAENYPGENYVNITGSYEHVPQFTLADSMRETAEKLGKNEEVAYLETENDSAKAAAVMEDLLNSGEEFSIVFVIQEEMASAVCRVLSQHGVLNNPIKVISEGAQTPIGVELIENGDTLFTISSSPGWAGYVAFREMWSYVNGKNQDKSRQIWLPIMPVDKEVVDKNDKTLVVPWETDPIYKELTEQYYPELMW